MDPPVPSASTDATVSKLSNRPVKPPATTRWNHGRAWKRIFVLLSEEPSPAGSEAPMVPVPLVLVNYS